MSRDLHRPSTSYLRETLERFAELLKNPRTPEGAWQKLFSEYPFIFSESLGLRLEPDDIHALGRPGRSEPDFIFYPKQGPFPCYGIIELKRADSLILSAPRKKILTLSRDAATAVAQATSYSRHLNNWIKIDSHSGLFVGSPAQLFVIMGLTAELRSKLTAEIHQMYIDALLPENCKIIPYDLLFRLFQRTVPPRLIVLAPLTVRYSEQTIVLVESDYLTAEWITEAIQPQLAERDIGIEVLRTETDFRRRADYWAARPPTLVITDVLLRWADPSSTIEAVPQEILTSSRFLGGLRCAHLLRSIDSTRSVPILFYSLMDKLDFAGGYEGIAPPKYYLQKTADTHELMELIEKVACEKARL